MPGQLITLRLSRLGRIKVLKKRHQSIHFRPQEVKPILAGHAPSLFGQAVLKLDRNGGLCLASGVYCD
jgi:hypothetical protein